MLLLAIFTMDFLPHACCFMVARWQMGTPPVTLHQFCRQKEDKGQRVKFNCQLSWPPFKEFSQKSHLAIPTYNSLAGTGLNFSAGHMATLNKIRIILILIRRRVLMNTSQGTSSIYQKNVPNFTTKYDSEHLTQTFTKENHY